MKSPLVPISIPSIYKTKSGDTIRLPAHMAQCTPDTHAAITSLAISLAAKGGRLILSDLFRSYDMQSSAYNDFISGRKQAFSPRPGGSFHEAGRAFDIDLGAIGLPLSEFWSMAAALGVYPIIKQPDAHLLEAWHFECRGSHQLVYDYYVARGTGINFSPYRAAAASAILSVGVRVDAFAANQFDAGIQSCLIRLGKDIGNMDGRLGHRTLTALEEQGITVNLRNKPDLLAAVEALMKQKFPGEYAVI